MAESEPIEDGDKVRIKDHMVGGGQTGIVTSGATTGLMFVETNTKKGTGAYYHVSDLERVD